MLLHRRLHDLGFLLFRHQSAESLQVIQVLASDSLLNFLSPRGGGPLLVYLSFLVLLLQEFFSHSSGNNDSEIGEVNPFQRNHVALDTSFWSINDNSPEVNHVDDGCGFTRKLSIIDQHEAAWLNLTFEHRHGVVGAGVLTYPLSQ